MLLRRPLLSPCCSSSEFRRDTLFLVVELEREELIVCGGEWPGPNRMPRDNDPRREAGVGVEVPDRDGEEGRVPGRLPDGVAQPLRGVIQPGVFHPLEVPLLSSRPIRFIEIRSICFLWILIDVLY